MDINVIERVDAVLGLIASDRDNDGLGAREIYDLACRLILALCNETGESPEPELKYLRENAFTIVSHSEH